MKKITTLNKPLQYTIIYSLFFIGFMAVCFLGADEAPDQPPMPLAQWLWIKGVTIAIIAACALIGRYLYRKGLLTIMNDKEEQDYE